MILDTCTYDFTGQKNLGKSYNDTMRNTSDEVTYICFRDGDTLWLTPDYGVHLAEYVRLYPNAVLTCWTNRINEKAEQQSRALVQLHGTGGAIPIRDCTDMTKLLVWGEEQKKDLYNVTALHGFISGCCMVVPKSVWQQTPFPEQQMFEGRGPYNLLGVDNYWTNAIRAKGVLVLRMDGMALYHTYRMITGDHDKKHLL